ncbi:MAG: TetR family transcriptional regulator [Nocardioides sp.]|uniref:TetR family transcriptional regulator n=1 Tax=Nocardioides sp. TaxID=35761 RepID=UPI003EFCF881
MPRIAEHRAPAEPTTPEQHERVKRILRAAAREGATKGFEGAQMTDVAKKAGVAIATLYRYFPSKHALFAAVMRDRVELMYDVVPDMRTTSRTASVANLLVHAGEQLLAAPQLARAMMTANNTPSDDPYVMVTSVFQGLLCSAAGVEQPTHEEMRMVRIVEQTWYGIVITALNGVITVDEAHRDTVTATKLLLGGLWD